MHHVFISYVREDEAAVQQLRASLEKIGVDIWLDRTHIKPGQRWRSAIRSAIRAGSYFLACFSAAYSARERTYMNEELTEAIEELRLRPSSRTWFIPVLLSATEIPDRDIGGGETLRDLQFVDLTTGWQTGIAAIVSVVSATEDEESRAGMSTDRAANLRWETLIVDTELSPYDTFMINPAKPWWPEEDGGAVVYDGRTGAIEMYGRQFRSREEANKHGQWLAATHNHRAFYAAGVHTLYFERVDRQVVANVPVLYAVVSNFASSHLILTSLEAEVIGVWPLVATGRSAALDATVTYEMVIPPRAGIYKRELIPALKIAGDDAVAFRIILRPPGRVGGYEWRMCLRLSTSWGESCGSPYFGLVM